MCADEASGCVLGAPRCHSDGLGVACPLLELIGPHMIVALMHLGTRASSASASVTRASTAWSKEYSRTVTGAGGVEGAAASSPVGVAHSSPVASSPASSTLLALAMARWSGVPLKREHHAERSAPPPLVGHP